MELDVIIGSLKYKDEMRGFANILYLNYIDIPNYDVIYPIDKFAKIRTYDNKLRSQIYLSKEYYKKFIQDKYMNYIENASRVIVFNKDGYIGKDTKRELECAINNNKIIYFLENTDEYNLEEIIITLKLADMNLSSALDKDSSNIKMKRFNQRMYKLENYKH